VTHDWETLASPSVSMFKHVSSVHQQTASMTTRVSYKMSTPTNFASFPVGRTSRCCIAFSTLHRFLPDCLPPTKPLHSMSMLSTEVVRPESYHLIFIDDIPNSDMFLGVHASIRLQPEIIQHTNMRLIELVLHRPAILLFTADRLRRSSKHSIG
jgi:hypothetical protein